MFDLVIFQVETSEYTFVFSVHISRHDKRRTPALATIFDINGGELSPGDYEAMSNESVPWHEAKRITKIITN